NPANNEVRIVGLENDVVEVVIMDMQGKILKTFADSDMFYIDFLPKGSYIVRILDNENKVHYQKLIKQ
ncbi:MAG: T9SS type A sorting domain-containing protein, partial [Bacteroidales bacterium]|nr:T9SS type A sorting domain-containing protein [Bacteroidales bacterium]